MKKIFIILLLFSLGNCYSQFATIINGITYSIDGELICSSAANPWNNEDKVNIHMDCYATFRNDTLVYSKVTAENGKVRMLEIFCVALADLDLNKAKIDWEKEFYSDNTTGLDKKIDIPVKENADKVSYQLWEGNSWPYKMYFHRKIKLNFVEDVDAKTFLKKLKSKAKQLKK
jgi:hypothetical protein